MEKVDLPAVLDDEALAARWNAGLRAREVQLDWSGVERVEPGALKALLAGLSQDGDSEVLGSSTLAGKETLAMLVAGTLETSPGDDAAANRPDRPRVAGKPKTWTAPPSKREAERSPSAAEPSPKAPTAGTRRAAPETDPGWHPAGRVLTGTTAVDARNGLHRLIEWDLLGPAGGENELVEEDSIVDRYLVGSLATPKERLAPELQDSTSTAEDEGSEDGTDDDGRSAKPALMPSSIGISFCVPAGVDDLVLEVSCGYYTRVELELEEDEDKPRRAWRREPKTVDVVLGVLSPGKLESRELWAERGRRALLDGVVADMGEGQQVVTLFLVNDGDHEKGTADARGTNWIFQPRITLRATDGRAVFRRRPSVEGGQAADEEQRQMAMLYRDRVEFATGHGVAASWDVDEEDPRRARQVWTEFLPSHEVPSMGQAGPDRYPALQDLCLDMRLLSEAEQADLRGMLEPLPEAYAEWIEGQRRRIQDPTSRLDAFETEAGHALENCAEVCERIRAGISLLEEDDQAARAFAFANRAMWLQRVRSKVAADRRAGGNKGELELDLPHNRSWRPFQLAFLLLNLESTTRLEHPDRSDPTAAIADLLFFPTGGGKTEAYLGLAAYVLGLRRLQGVVDGRDGNAGVAVIMRYTLRLLTLQQFQRAAALICACEKIRGDSPEIWGKEVFRIGLWVGMGSTPNRTDGAAEALKDLRGTTGGRPGTFRGRIGGSGSPVQLRSCPWCGTEIDPARHMHVDSFRSGHGRTRIYCPNYREPCPFSEQASGGEGVPAVVVDEEIYRTLPAFLIATVDKFAQMPWNGAVQSLFGRVTGRCPRHGFVGPEIDDGAHTSRGRLPATQVEPHAWLRPPDLIIQDELHLISGPLGTMTGAYETAVDELCSWTVDGRRVRPKVVASTATVRRAPEQVRRLFLRSLKTFPPSGLDISDNFFAYEVPTSEAPGRRYLGLCAMGRRQRKAQIQTYVTLMCAGQKLRDLVGDDSGLADPYLTLVGYFISMRELAGMRRVVDDDVRSRARKTDIEKRGLSRRLVRWVEELTSRLPSARIPEVLERLEREHAAWNKDDPEARRRPPYDVLLATNMISVGVDVSRLGLMVAAGQPKATAEYIQATSRVGREHPGLVLTIYNWARPRDLSHYERFRHYHATFYQQVEPLSVTPFAPRAMDRSMAGLLVSLIRLTDTRWNENRSAADVKRDDRLVNEAIETIVFRAVNLRSDTAVEAEVRARLAALLDTWSYEQRPREGGALLGYKKRRGDGRTVPLLHMAGQGPWQIFTSLNSLREVEATSPLMLQQDVRLDGSEHQWTAAVPDGEEQ